MDLHERLSEALRLRGMTQRDLAHAIDYSEATISKWVQGRALPPTAALVDVCTALTISADWLLWGGELSEKQPIETTPRWETVDTNFSTSSTSFDEFLEPARSLFFTSAWLPRAFDSHNPVLSRLVSQGITMRFVFPHPELTLVPYNTDGLESHNQHQRKRLRVLSSLYQLQDWQTRCQVELRLIVARPVNNIVAINAESSQGKILYIPYL